MDFSLRSLQSQSGKTKDRRAASKRFQQEDTMNLNKDDADYQQLKPVQS